MTGLYGDVFCWCDREYVRDIDSRDEVCSEIIHIVNNQLSDDKYCQFAVYMAGVVLRHYALKEGSTTRATDYDRIKVRERPSMAIYSALEISTEEGLRAVLKYLKKSKEE